MGLTAGSAYRQIRTLRKIAEGITNLLTFKESEGQNHKRSLKRLLKNGYIILSGEKIMLSPVGKKLLQKIDREKIVITIPEKWDGNWHLIAYDIPEKLKRTRNRFRKKLKEHDFTRLQGSLWLFPYNCKEEIAIFAQSLGIEQYVMYLTTEYIPDQNKYKNKYNLS